MDIIKEVNGQKQTYCIPASQYVAQLIKNDIHDEYDIEVEFAGTGAKLIKYSKRKIVDHYDKEHILYVRTKMPPVNIGGFYWGDACRDIAVFYKTNTDAENKKLQNEGILQIPYDVFKHLREQDLVEIKGYELDKDGKEVKIQFKAAQWYIAKYGKFEPVPGDMPLYKIPRDKFIRKKIDNILSKKKRNLKKSGG